MKKTLTFISVFLLSGMVFGQTATKLFFSEYVEGTSTSKKNKAFEIYNGTGSPVDLSNYSVRLWTNGKDSASIGTTWADTLVLSGTLASGDVYVVYNPQCDATLITGDLADAVAGFNGNDALGLFKNGSLIDMIGDTTSFVTNGWDVADSTEATKDHTLVRKSTVTEGNTNWTSSRGTNSDDSEWIVYGADEFSYLGWHINKPVSNQTAILTFVVDGQQGSSVIDAVNHTVSFNLPAGTDLSAIVPTITVSDGATISPASGVARNFTSDITYTITAEDGTTSQVWTVSANWVTTLFEDDFESGSLSKWTTYSVTGDQVWTAIAEQGYDSTYCAKITSYVDTVSYENEDWLITPVMDFSKVSNVVLTFSNACKKNSSSLADMAVLYSINYSGSGAPSTATWDTLDANMSTGKYSWTASGDVDLSAVTSSTVSIAFSFTSTTAASKIWEVDNVIVTGVTPKTLSSETDITSFTIPEQFVDATIDAVNHTVTMQVVNGTSLSSLVPTITVSTGATIDPESGVSQDFNNTVVYTVTAQDGTSIQAWNVTVTVASQLSSAADFLTFSFTEQVSDAVINTTDATITCTVANDEDLATLTPTFTISAGAQVSPTTATDFSSPVEFVITAQDGTTTKTWTVTVKKSSAVDSEISLSDFAVYPNPVSDQLYFSGIENVSCLYITNMMGQTVYQTSQLDASIPVSNYNKGLYLIVVSDNQGNKCIRKIVKQ